MTHQATPDDQYRLGKLSAEILRQAPVWVRSNPSRSREYLAAQLATELGRLAREGVAWAIRIRDLHLESGVPAMIRDARFDQVIDEIGRDLSPEEQARVMGVLLLGGSAADGAEMLDLPPQSTAPPTSSNAPAGRGDPISGDPPSGDAPRDPRGDSDAD